VDSDVLKEQELMTTADPAPYALMIDNYRKVFGKKVAVDKMSICLEPGEVKK
jgi:hypothetical protein